MPDVISLTIEEPTGVLREGWPLRRGVPLPRNELNSTSNIRLLNPAGDEHPCCVKESARWPDGSIKWILIDFQISIGPQESEIYKIEYGPDVLREKVDSNLAVESTPSGIRVNTDALSFFVDTRNFKLLEQVQHLGKHSPSELSQDFTIKRGDTVYRLSEGETHEVLLEEVNAFRATIRASGTFGQPECFDYLVRITAFADLSWLEMELTFLNREDSEFTEISEIVFNNTLPRKKNVTGSCGSGRKIYSSTEPFYFYHEEVLENYGVFSGSSIYREDGTKVEGIGMYEQQLARGWLDESNQESGVCISMRDFVALYPKEATWTPGQIDFSIWPERSCSLRLHQGIARTHTIMVHFHACDAAAARVEELAAAFDEPLLPQNSNWYLESGAFGLVLPHLPDRYPLIERQLRDQTVQTRNTRSLGMVDFGDYVNPGTGSQGGFSTNNEPDRLHGFLIQHIRTGDRIAWGLVEAAVWHTIDIDMVHHTTRDPLELGGVRIHGHDHVQYDAEGYPNVSTVPSHMWTEGLLEYYHLTGHPRFYEAALSIGECFLRMVERGWTSPPYHSSWHSCRDSGWPLIGMAAVFEATGDHRFLEGMRSVFEAVRAAQHDNGGWSIELFFNEGFCPFQIGVCLTGLARYHEATDDEEALDVFLRGIEFLGGEAMRFPDGTWMYITTNDYRSTYYSDSPLEPFGYAYHVSKNSKLIEKALKGWTRSLDLRATPRFLWAAHHAGLLQDG